MCEIFPEVTSCCIVINLRLGMLLISVLAIMTGVAVLCVIEQRTNANYQNLHNITTVDEPMKAVRNAHQIIVSSLTLMSVVFMLTGLILMFATLTDQEGLVQVFVWVTFLNIIIGFVISAMVGVQCLVKDVCLLSGMDWLSAAATLVFFDAFLFLWIYFIIVANSYVLNGGYA